MSKAKVLEELARRAGLGDGLAMDYTARLAGAAGVGAAAAQSQDAEAMFLGKAAKTADKFMLGIAEKMDSAGLPPNEIWKKTGWGKGADNKWRFEIDDSKASMKPLEDWGWAAGKDFKQSSSVVGPTTDFMTHSDLASSYDEFLDFGDGNTRLTMGVTPNKIGGSFGSGHLSVGSVTDSAGRTVANQSTALHELQHGVQRREGFARGGNINTVPLSERPTNPAFTEWLKNEDIAKSASNLRNSSDYAAELSSSNEAFKSTFEPKIDILDADLEKGALTDEQWSEGIGSVFEEFNQFKKNMYPTLTEVDRLNGMASIDPPSQKLSAFDSYNNLSGEVEARNTQTRMGMDDKARRESPPWQTEDVPRSQQIIRYGGSGAAVLGGLSALTPEQALAQPYSAMERLSAGRPSEARAAKYPSLHSFANKIDGLQDPTGMLVDFSGTADYLRNFGEDDTVGRKLLRAFGAAPF